MLGLYLLLNFLVLWMVARASSATGLRLVLMLFLLGFIVGSANNLIEALFFRVLQLRELAAAAIPAALVFAILSPLAVLLSGRWNNAAGRAWAEGGFTPATLLMVVVAYEILYWTAGSLVYPYIADFYATTRTIPPAYAVSAVQVLRSLIFVGAVYPLLKSGLRGAPLVLALVYSVIGGVAPLLPDNPFMPPNIRFYHAVETSLSNFLFGLVVAFLFTLRRPAIPAQA
ncbi:MAG: hypothetical protein HOP95_08605 [Sphingomonas sp.]|nr:hypothetical protein [Sphingomonas sp.]